MLIHGSPIQRRNPSNDWGFCCGNDQDNGQGMAPHELGITEQRSIIPAPSHPLQSTILDGLLSFWLATFFSLKNNKLETLAHDNPKSHSHVVTT